MKKLVVILCLAALFAACSKNDNVKPALKPQTVTTAEIMGTWKLSADTSYQSVNGQLKSTVNLIEPGSTITYGQNGIGSGTTDNTTNSFNYSLTDGVITVSVDSQSGDFIILDISSAKMLVRVSEGASYIDEVLLKQ